MRKGKRWKMSRIMRRKPGCWATSWVMQVNGVPVDFHHEYVNQYWQNESAMQVLQAFEALMETNIRVVNDLLVNFGLKHSISKDHLVTKCMREQMQHLVQKRGDLFCKHMRIQLQCYPLDALQDGDQVELLLQMLAAKNGNSILYPLCKFHMHYNNQNHRMQNNKQ